MPAADLVVLELGPTASYARRDAVFIPLEPGADPRDGALTIVVQGSRRAGARVESDTYGVQEESDEDLPAGIRSFLLENEFDPDAYGPFRVIVGGMAELCGCEAGWFDRSRPRPTGCKHKDALRALIEHGVL